jgi:hypothetical protein
LAKLPPILALCVAIAAAAPPPGLARDAPIPDSRFPTYVKFAGDKGNQGLFANQARCDVGENVPRMPFFFAGFFRPEDFVTFGMLVSFGNQDNRGAGLIALSTQGNALLSFEWFGNGWQPLNIAPAIWPSGSVALNQWSFIALKLNTTSSRDIVMDGVPGVEQIDTSTGRTMVAPWPSPHKDGSGLAITFGSYYNITASPNFGVSVPV